VSRPACREGPQHTQYMRGQARTCKVARARIHNRGTAAVGEAVVVCHHFAAADADDAAVIHAWAPILTLLNVLVHSIRISDHDHLTVHRHFALRPANMNMARHAG
jgi:hypothetical protein